MPRDWWLRALWATKAFYIFGWKEKLKVIFEQDSNIINWKRVVRGRRGTESSEQLISIDPFNTLQYINTIFTKAL